MTNNSSQSDVIEESQVNMSIPEPKPLIIFGTDVTRVPCFRSTFLYSIQGGIGLGLATFLFTSRVRLATNVGLTSFAFISCTYWVFCRYQHSKQKFLTARLKSGLQDYVIYEGTPFDQHIKGNDKDDSPKDV